MSWITCGQLPYLSFALFLKMLPLRMGGVEFFFTLYSLRLVATSPPWNHPRKRARFKRDEFFQSRLWIRNIEFPSIEYRERELPGVVIEYNIARNSHREDLVEVGKLLLN